MLATLVAAEEKGKRERERETWTKK